MTNKKWVFGIIKLVFGVLAFLLIVLLVGIKIIQQELETIDNVQSRGIEIWHEKKAIFGDTRKAREMTVEEIRKMGGVKESDISADNFTIWIKYYSGVEGLLMLNPEGTL